MGGTANETVGETHSTFFAVPITEIGLDLLDEVASAVRRSR